MPIIDLVFYFIQVFTTLDLAGNNSIGAEGVRHLASALRFNKVKELRCILIHYYLFLCHADNHDAKRFEEIRRRVRCAVFS